MVVLVHYFPLCPSQGCRHIVTRYCKCNFLLVWWRAIHSMYFMNRWIRVLQRLRCKTLTLLRRIKSCSFATLQANMLIFSKPFDKYMVPTHHVPGFSLCCRPHYGTEPNSPWHKANLQGNCFTGSSSLPVQHEGFVLKWCCCWGCGRRSVRN